MLRPSLHGAKEFWDLFRESKQGVAGLIIVIFFTAVAIMAPLLSPYNPYKLSDKILVPPDQSNLLGTDNVGRDVFSRVIWGTRVSMMFAIGVALMTAVIGAVVGAIPGYYGGLVDDAFSRFFEFFIMIMSVRLVLLIIAVFLFGTNILFTMVIIGITGWPVNARLMRSQVLTLKTRAYVLASVGAGANPARVLFRHIIPNGIYPVIANSAMEMAHAVTVEAALSFLGLGDVNVVSWGQILQAARINLTAWWMSIFPGLALVVLVTGFVLLGDGISYALNPRLRTRQE